MNIELRIHFEKNINSKIEEWKITYTYSGENPFIEVFQAIMETMQESTKEIQKTKYFNRFLKIIITQKIKKYNTIVIVKSKSCLTDFHLINLEYLLNFNWKKLNTITLSKIIKTNFNHLMYNLDQKEKNTINNLSRIINENIDDVFIQNFKEQKIIITDKIDSPEIKSQIYKTPVRYRNT